MTMKMMLIFMMLKKTTIITFILIPSLRPLVTFLPLLSFSLILCTLFFRAAAFLIFPASGVPLASSLALLNCCMAATSWNFLLLSVRYFHIVLHWFAPFCLTRKCNCLLIFLYQKEIPKQLLTMRKETVLVWHKYNSKLYVLKCKRQTST